MALLALIVLCNTFIGCGNEDPVKEKTPKKNSIISVDSVYVSDLNAGMLPNGLINELAAQGIKVSAEATVKVGQEGKEWLITDKENQQGVVDVQEYLSNRLSLYLLQPSF